ncbi:hypothetical protein [Futiania mangrovi]|uniref:Uncharacterized protein n=1 Tax=Futiania mangrovi TaxID=2959716 RepID=A0A9J6PGZ9_9PROT|nr:hypothetical protein [Futiania mangrovii]MCP1337096.1 hypothetical protein [Futiania mangrovii]
MSERNGGKLKFSIQVKSHLVLRADFIIKNSKTEKAPRNTVAKLAVKDETIYLLEQYFGTMHHHLHLAL